MNIPSSPRRTPIWRITCQTIRAALVGAVVWGTAGGQGQTLDVRTHTLQNGLKILVHEDHDIPNVALYLFYRVGSRDERPGTTGISHFFEHMMFNGARKYGPKQFDITMEAAGGANNAYTDLDVTVYMNWFPAQALELIFDLEADRIAHLAFDPQMVESERGVIASERRTAVDANHAGLLEEQLWAAAFTAHPYQWPVIGWMVDIEHWQLEDLKRHFQMGYSPANATLVVVGHVQYSDVVALAQRYLEPIPATGRPPPVTTREPEQAGERRVTVVKFAQLPWLMVGYHVPETKHPDSRALQVLRHVLVSGQSSRLYQRLVDRDQLAIEVQASLNLALDPTLFTLSVQPREGVPTQKVEQALSEEFASVRSDGVREHELEKARNMVLVGFYRELQTISGKAQALGNAELFLGDYQRLFTLAQEYAQVSGADVQRVARDYFTDRNRTVAVLVPEQEEPTGSATRAQSHP